MGLFVFPALPPISPPLKLTVAWVMMYKTQFHLRVPAFIGGRSDPETSAYASQKLSLGASQGGWLDAEQRGIARARRELMCRSPAAAFRFGLVLAIIVIDLTLNESKRSS